MRSVRYWWKKVGMRVFCGGLVALGLLILLMLNLVELPADTVWGHVALGLIMLGGGGLVTAYVSSSPRG